MAVKLVVFDIAGTTVKDDDHSVSKAFQSAFREFAFDIALERIDLIMGYEKTLAIKKILDENDPDLSTARPELIRDIHEVFVKEMIAHYQYDPGVIALPEVEETFKFLHNSGIKIGINTGFSRDIAQTIIDRLGWMERGLIDYYIGSDEVESGRPFPFMIQRLMEYSGITNAAEVVKVGDTEVDIREGQHAGCLMSIGITTGIFSRDELLKVQPTHIIDSMSALIPLITG